MVFLKGCPFFSNMKKRLFSIAFGGALIVFAGFRSDSGKEWQYTFSKIDAEVKKNSKAYATLDDAIRNIGHRLTGSENGERAEEYAYRLFRSYGFRDVKYQPFEVESWMRNEVTLSIAPDNSDNFHDLEVVALAHSPVSAKVDAHIVDVANGLKEDFELLKEKVRGKVVLANIGLVNAPGRTNLHRSEKTALAIAYGAAGIIMVNNAPGQILMTGTASVDGSLIPIPAVCISNDSGRELRAWILEEGPLVAQISMSNASRPIRARNVIATLKGKSDEKIVIGGHLDSWDLATGAIDNGIGSFAVMDIARTFRALKIKPKRTIEFVMFMGEEEGLLGSRHYVRELARLPRADKVRCMINLDMTNDPMGVNGFGRPEAEPLLKEIGNMVKKIDTSYANRYVSRAGLHSDHQPFLLEGFPVLGFLGRLPDEALQCYHADCDHFNLVNRRELESTVRIVSMYLFALANAPTLPSGRMSPEETREFLVSQGLKEELVLGKDWRW